MKLNLIVGVNKQNGIGMNGTMPWYFPEDLKYFQKITKTVNDTSKNNVVLMGRNTMNSIKRFPLGGRINACISTTIHSHEDASVLFFSSFDDAITKLSSRKDVDNIFVIGGAMLYEACLQHKEFKYLYMNELNDDSKCDVFFPIIDLNDYILKDRTQISENVVTNLYEKL